MKLEEFKSSIEGAVPNAIVGEDQDSTPGTLVIEPTFLHQVCEFLHTDAQTYFDQLSCLTGIDNGEESRKMEVIYNLYSIPKNFHLMLKVIIDRTNPTVDSVSDIWKTADWHERESYDLLGIIFNNHPDLRRILLPNDWEGFPLRKDYVEQEKYHEVKVKY